MPSVADAASKASQSVMNIDATKQIETAFTQAIKSKEFTPFAQVVKSSKATSLAVLTNKLTESLQSKDAVVRENALQLVVSLSTVCKGRVQAYLYPLLSLILDCYSDKQKNCTSSCFGSSPCIS